MKKILIVEDNKLYALMMKTFIKHICGELGLSETDYVIEQTGEEEEAIRLISSNDYCLIILDGDLWEGGHGMNVISSIDDKNFQKIIVASTDENFVKGCKDKNIHALNKKDLLEVEDVIKKLIETIMQKV